MATPEELLSLLSFNDLARFEQSAQASDIYGQAGAALNAAPINYSQFSPMETGVTAFGKAFLSGLLQNYGRNQVAEQTSAIVDILPQLNRDPYTTQTPEGVDSGPFSMLRGTAILKDFEGKAALNEQKKSRTNALLVSILPDLAKANKLSVADTIKIATSDDPASALASLDQPKILPSLRPARQDLGPSLGVENLEDMSNRIFQEKIAAGVPAAQAEVSARDAVEALRKRSKDLIAKKLADEMDTISQAEDIVRKGEEGILKAGSTGSKAASWYESLVSTFVPWSTPEADTQAQGDALLSQTKQLGAAINRIKGSGSLSDFESKALFETAMGADKPVPVNEQILKGYKNGLSIMKEHNSFMNYFLDKTGGNPETAQNMWEIYKKYNPIVVQDPNTGSFILNENRIPWQKFNFQKGYETFLKGDLPQEAQAITPQKQYKASELTALGYRKTPNGWVK